MIANGPGQRPERDNGKKLYASVQFQPGAGNQLELYGDIDMIPGGDSTLKSFVGRSGERIQGGVEIFMRVDREAAVTDAGEDKTRMGLSAFASLPVTSDWRCFARLDAVNDDDLNTTDLVVIGGLDWAAAQDIHFLPNLYIQLPDGPDAHLQARVTALFKF